MRALIPKNSLLLPPLIYLCIVFYLPGGCVHTLTPRENRERNILRSSEKTQYLMNTLYHSEDTVRVFSFILYAVTKLWLVFQISRQSSENVLNRRIGLYFPNTLYLFFQMIFMTGIGSFVLKIHYVSLRKKKYFLLYSQNYTNWPVNNKNIEGPNEFLARPY